MSFKKYIKAVGTGVKGNRDLSKDEIIGHVWDYDADVLPNTVEVYIRYLRQKIDDPFDKPIIHTARGFGYSVKE